MRYVKNPIAGRDAHIMVNCDDMTDFIELSDDGAFKDWNAYTGRRDFFNRSYNSAVECAVMGDASSEDEIEKMMEQFQDMPIKALARERVKAYHGGRVSIPAYIMGKPKPSRKWVIRPVAHAPLTIVVNVGSSGGVRKSTLKKRGVAIAAMVAQLAKTRPVEFHLAVGGIIRDVTSFISVEFPMGNVDLSRLAFLLADQGFARAMGFAAMSGATNIYKGTSGRRYAYPRSISWPFHSESYIGGKADGSVTRAQEGRGAQNAGALFAQELAPGNTDMLYFGGTYLGSSTEASIDNDPVAWVKSMLADHA